MSESQRSLNLKTLTELLSLKQGIEQTYYLNQWVDDELKAEYRLIVSELQQRGCLVE